tara:strand:+ start:496 stop:735 length:240 start_codon:yes stop_codon:yes gene_type:complete
MICHALDSAGAMNIPSSVFPSLGMSEGTYVANLIRYRKVETTDARSGATVHGTFIDAKSANLWLFQTAPGCQSFANFCP